MHPKHLPRVLTRVTTGRGGGQSRHTEGEMEVRIKQTARGIVTIAMALTLAGSLVGCGGQQTTDTTKPEAPKTTDVVLASTTSTQDSGLFDVLIPAFEKAMPQYKVKVIAVGSGEALKLGEKKDADVLLVHSPGRREDVRREGLRHRARRPSCTTTS